MKVKSLEQAKELAYACIGIDMNHDNRPVIRDQWTLDFEWGIVFYYNGRRFVEENDMDAAYFESPPVLVDKVSGEAKHIGKFDVVDIRLEEYRKLKGYPFVVKIKINEQELQKLPRLQQVITLFETGEIYHVKKGLEIIRKYNLVDLQQLEKIVYYPLEPDRTFEENIAAHFRLQYGDRIRAIHLGAAIGSQFPTELKLFKDSISLNLSNVKLHSISEHILELSELKSIHLWFAKIETINPAILQLKKLEDVIIVKSKLGKQAQEILDKLKVENGVKIS